MAAYSVGGGPGPADGPAHLRVVTWNVWGRHGPWEKRQPALVETLRGTRADVVTLQEAWGVPGGDDQAALLAEGLGMVSVSALGETQDGSLSGTAILSRWPLLRTARQQIALPGARDRWAQLVVVDSPAGPLTVVTVHLAARHDDSALRQEQATVVLRFVAAERTEPIPALLTGDLNAEPDSDEVRRLVGLTAAPARNAVFSDAWTAAGDGPGHTWHHANPYAAEQPWPNRRLDYVLYGQSPQGDDAPEEMPYYRPVRTWLIGTEPIDGVQPSDHYGVASDLQLRWRVPVRDEP
jgi:endonuclease/exonuclease/phosphatase family metal-dependent hydrolase